jgi:hypothetical protein
MGGKEARMNLRWLIVVALLLMQAWGCAPGRRRHDAYQEMLDAEKRYLEDQLYDLQYEYGVLQDQHQSTLRENEALRRTLQDRKTPGAPGRETPTDDAPVPPSGLDDLAPPQIELGPPSEPGRPSVEPPAITPPGELIPGPSARPDMDAIPPASSSEDFPSAQEELIDPRITHLYLNPLATGGADLDNQPGDDGVSLLIEPRNAADKYVAMAGPLSVVVLDPAKQDEAARLARWDFSVDEVRERMAGSLLSKGIHLQLPWPQERPQATRLHLYVRYMTPEGARLEADREIFVEPPGHVSTRWTPHAGGHDAAVLPSDAELPSEIPPAAAFPRISPRAATSPPPGPAASDNTARPQWRPYR